MSTTDILDQIETRAQIRARAKKLRDQADRRYKEAIKRINANEAKELAHAEAQINRLAKQADQPPKSYRRQWKERLTDRITRRSKRKA